MSPTVALVGLGNPGRKYASTRHNVGFMVIDALCAHPSIKVLRRSKEKNLDCVWVELQGTRCVLLKPQSFMNDSGVPVGRFTDYHTIPADRIIVIHDDLDLAFGELRKAFDRGDAGHQGVASLVAQLGTNAFHRIRIGIGSNRAQGIPSEAYVLQPFTEQELIACTERVIPSVITVAAELVLKLSL